MDSSNYTAFSFQGCWNPIDPRYLILLTHFLSFYLCYATSGTLYSYSAYSADLQALLGYSGTQVNIVSSIGDLGLYIGATPMGFFFDKFGPLPTYLLGSVCLFAGYALMWAGSIGRIPSNSIMMGLYMTLVGYGSSAGYMAGLLTNSKNFEPQHRGKIVAVLVAAYGLSAAIFSQIYQRAFDHDVTKLFWILAIILGIVPILGIFLVRSVPISVSPSVPSPPTDSSSLISIENGVQTGSTNSTPTSLTYSPGKYGDLKGLAVIIHPDFLLLFAVIICCTGVGLTWINIIGSIVKSYRITAIPASGYVIGLSVANAAGRLLFGLLTDLKSIPLPAVWLLIPCLGILILTHLALIWTTNYIALLIVTLLTGLSYGGSFAVMPVIINRYYGDKNYGSNLGLLILAVAIGSMAMGAVSGAIYDSEAAHQHAAAPIVPRALLSAGSAKLCYGLPCFRWTYVMTTCVSVVGVAIAAFLLHRELGYDRRKRYQDDFDRLTEGQ